MINIGYACLNIGPENISYKRCIKKNASYDNLVSIIEHNIISLEKAIDYLILNNIKLFRISSEIIPFGSSDVNTVEWWILFKDKLTNIGHKIKKHNIRVSMHLGHYSILNSPNKIIVDKTIRDLKYHTLFLDSLNTNKSSKIIIHVGGVYNNKKLAMERFIKNYNKLNDEIKSRLVIENDDKSYTVNDVLEIHKITSIPVVFDNLHHNINHIDFKNNRYWILRCMKTWDQSDGCAKVHYSEQDKNKQKGSHSKTIDLNTFDIFFREIKDLELDIMLEVKDKNLSAIKCINTFIIYDNNQIKNEWLKYKYNVLEKSEYIYQEINNLINCTNSYDPKKFYSLLDYAIELEPNKTNSVKTIKLLWNHYKDIVSPKEKDTFLKYLINYKKGSNDINRIKKYLYKLAIIYNIKPMLESYYFII